MITVCSICLSNPCNPRCPNAPEPEPIYTCSRCGYGIFDGDKYLDGPDGKICEECLEDMAVSELLGILGEELLTAEKEGM